MKKKTVTYALLILSVLFPLFSNSSWITIGTTFVIYSIVSLSQDIVLGRAGMFDMGHAIYFGMGAYTTAILNSTYGVPVLLTIPFAVIIPVIFAVLLAAPIVHLKGDYLLVATLGFNVVFEQALKNNLLGITGGPNGIFGVGVPAIFGIEFSSQASIYYFSLSFLFLTLLIMNNLEASKTGRALHYINEDSLASETIGINTRFYKIFAFAISAALSGLAGVAFAVQYSTVSPEAFSFIQSVLFFTIVIVGGQSSIPGVLIGTFLMFVVPEIFREFATARYFVFGIAMILTMILRPKGIWPVKFGRIPKYIRH